MFNFKTKMEDELEPEEMYFLYISILIFDFFSELFSSFYQNFILFQFLVMKVV